MGKEMTIKEMIYVIDKEKECIQKRECGECDKQCQFCESHLETGTLLDAFERIVNLIFTIDKHSTKKEY